MPMITENKHLLRDPELSSVTRNCQFYIMPLESLKIGIYKLKDFMNCIKVKRNNLLNSIYSSVSPDFRFKETLYVNSFTDPELSSSLYVYFYGEKCNNECGSLALNSFEPHTDSVALRRTNRLFQGLLLSAQLFRLAFETGNKVCFG